MVTLHWTYRIWSVQTGQNNITWLGTYSCSGSFLLAPLWGSSPHMGEESSCSEVIRYIKITSQTLHLGIITSISVQDSDLLTFLFFSTDESKQATLDCYCSDVTLNVIFILTVNEASWLNLGMWDTWWSISAQFLFSSKLLNYLWSVK